MGVSKNNGTPKSSILIGFSIVNHPCWGPTPVLGNIHVVMSSVFEFISSPIFPHNPDTDTPEIKLGRSSSTVVAMLSSSNLGAVRCDQNPVDRILFSGSYPIGSMGMVYLPTWMVDFMVNVGKYIIHGSYMAITFDNWNQILHRLIGTLLLYRRNWWHKPL